MKLMVMRRTSGAAAVLVLVACLGPASMLAQQAWYAAYEDALAAIQRQEWTKAESLLKAALQRNPRQGRRVLFYGTRREDYLPEYHLAVVYANQQRVDEALELFAKVERAGLVARGSREYPELERLVALGRSVVEKRMAAGAGDGRPGPVVAQPGNEDASGATNAEAALAARAEAERRERFASLLSQAAGELAAGRLESARARAVEARNMAVDAGRVDELDRDIQVAGIEARTRSAVDRRDPTEAQRLVDELRKVDPRNARVVVFDAAIAELLAEAAAGVMRLALRAFFGGDYQATIRLLEPVVADTRQPAPRALFYLACSHVALGLLEGPRGAPRLQRGRELYARVRRTGDAFTSDRRFLSPQIIRTLEAP